MSQIFPKNKEKRPRTPSNEANTSFVKNVTSRVSGLLPSTITKWFSSPSSSSANGSAPTADASDSSTEDEATEVPVITQPPAKRMRYNTSGSYNYYGPTDASCSTNDVDMIEMPYSPFGGTQYAQPSRITHTTSLRPPNEEQDEGEREPAHMFKLPHTVAGIGIGQSIANKRKSIFDTTSKEETIKSVAKSASNTVRDPKQPSFKPSLLGSPFYPGRTMYGGAASSYMNQPNIKQQTVAVVNESKHNDDTAISSSARRIMDLLESYSSPLMEARRVPLYTKPKNDGFNTTADRYSPYTNKSFSYKTQELHVPSIASILRLKKKSRLMDTTNAARQIIASHSSASNYPTYPAAVAAKGNEPEKEIPNKMTTKVKSRLTRTNRGNQDELDMATPVKLPTGVLQIDQDKLPKFSFGTSVVTKPPATSTPKTIFPTADKKNIQVSTSKHETFPTSVFKFSNPVKVSSDTPQVGTPPKFTFESPERRIDQKFESKRVDCSVVVGVIKEPEKYTTKSKEWPCADCWVKNKPEDKKCICCGSTQPLQNAKCSVCKLADSQPQKEKCINCEKMSVLNVASPLIAKSTAVDQSSKWKCEDCWVSNLDSAVKCACCGGSRPKKTIGTPVTATVICNPATITSISSTFSLKTATFTPNTATVTSKTVTSTLKDDRGTIELDVDWKCDDCWISNKSTVDKCAACGGARPGAKQSSVVDATSYNTSFFGTSDDKLKTIAKSQNSDKWECPSCLVRNYSETNKCVCCGTEKEKKNKMPESKFNFGMFANNSFKFGIDPKIHEATISKKPEAPSTLESKLIAPSETNNNVLAETPTFTFSLPAKKVNNIIETPKEKSEEAPKMNFSFGIPKQPVVTNKLSEPTKILEEEKFQEVPSVDLNSPEQGKPKPQGNLFMSPLTQVTNENKALSSATLVNNTLAAEASKHTPSDPITLPTASNTETPKPAFSFGVNSSPKLFDTPTSAGTSSMNMFTQPSQSTTLPTTSAPALSLFKQTETSMSTTSLFQQPDLTVKPASIFQNSETTNNAAAAPVFSFGNTGPSNSAPPAALTLPSALEQPKFQFTFGSTSTPNTDSSGLFKSPFGSTESNANRFSAGPSLGSNNNLSTNTIGGSKGLSTTNGLTGNTLGPMSGNTMSGSTLTGSTIEMGNGTTMSNTLGGPNGLSTNPLSGGNGLQPGNSLPGTSLFNNTVQKENVWSTSNNSPTPNLFVSNTATSSLQKPSTFTFGSATPFNAANSTPAFGSTAPAPQNIFAMGNQNNNNQPSIFSNTVQSPPAGNLFGSPQPPSNPGPQMPMFGTPSISSTPTFGSPNPPMPSFEAPSLTPAPAPAFNFGSSQSTGIFGFGQQPQMQQQQLQQQQQQQQPLQHQAATSQSGVYSFGGAPAGGAPQVQFSMGSGANPAVRRVRKAVRRNLR